MKLNYKETYPVETFQKIIYLLETRGYIIDELDELSSTQVEHLEKYFDDLVKEYNINTNLTAEDLMGIGKYYPDRGAIYIKWNKNKIEDEKVTEILEDFYIKTQE